MPKGQLRDNYKEGKIYRLLGAGITDTYVGSTCGSLYRRLWHHNHMQTTPTQRQMSSALIYQRSPTVAIELLEDYPCDTKQELGARERYWIEKFRAEGVNVVNHNLPTAGLSAEELRIRKNTQRRERNRANLYHCPCGKTIQSAQKEEHLASYLHAKRLKTAQWVQGDIQLSSQTPASSSTSQDMKPVHQDFLQEQVSIFL